MDVAIEVLGATTGLASPLQRSLMLGPMPLALGRPLATSTPSLTELVNPRALRFAGHADLAIRLPGPYAGTTELARAVRPGPARMITCARRVRPALGIGGCVSRIAVARLQLARDARIRCSAIGCSPPSRREAQL